MTHIPFDKRLAIAHLPHLPGVYRMLDAKGVVLYVGKAVDLKRRVSSYFQGKQTSARIGLMVKKIANIETTVTRSESEALILEYQLIQALSPRYNILFRDDKSYPYLIISRDEWPQLSYFRGLPNKYNHYFGPFPSSDAVRQSIQILQRVFQLRTCNNTVFANRSRPCLLYQIKRCSAPCVKKVTPAIYAHAVRDTTLFLEGHNQVLLRDLSERMTQAAEQFDFESAAQWRDQIRALKNIQEKQFVSSHVQHQLNADVIAVVAEEGMVCINLVMIRGGRHLGDKSFFPIHADPNDCEASLEAFLMHYYLRIPLPTLIIHRYPLQDYVCRHFFNQANHRLRFVKRPTGEKRVWLEMAEKNAKLAIAQKCFNAATGQARLSVLREVLAIPTLERLECFDISHTQGQGTVAACVVYDQGTMRPAEYRRYHIQSTAVGDDYAAMHEVLFRRYKNSVAHDSKCPDVVLIDGGQGQVNVAVKLLKTLALDIPVVGISKGKARKVGMETLILPYCNQSFQLPPDHLALLLIQLIRDEAHRFAVNGHRIIRSKTQTLSVLENIHGIGNQRRKQLLTHFKGLKGIMVASVDDLTQIDGVGLVLAKKIYHTLHQSSGD